MATVNIDPHRQREVGYRYQMPTVETKIEGQGNGVKTVICNVEVIAKSLNRKVDYIMKFFESECAAKAQCKDGKYILAGKHANGVLQNKIFEFITKFVLCQKCRNPETNFVVQDALLLHCNACQYESRIAQTEKLYKFIIKEERPVDIFVCRKVERDKLKREQPTDITEIENPVFRYQRELHRLCSVEDQYNAALDIKLDYDLSLLNMVQLIFSACIDENINEQQIKMHSPLLARAIQDDNCQRVVIEELMGFCLRFRDTADRRARIYKNFPMYLKYFYDNDILSEKSIMSWSNGNPTNALDRDAQTEFQAMTKPLIDFLRQPESDSDIN